MLRKMTVASALATACVGLSVPAAVAAQDAYPARAVTMIVPFGPGGTSDIMGRLLQKSLGEALGTSVVVDNRAGAGGAIGMAMLARSRPDGYTVGLSVVGPEAIQPALRKTGYSPSSFDHLCGTYAVPLMMMVPKASPFRNLDDVLRFAKANPGKLAYGSSGTGTVLHLSMQSLLQQADIEGLHVPYKSSGEMVTGLLGQQILLFNETPTVSNQYDLRSLAVFSEKRLANYPEVPTVAELGYRVQATVWGGLIAPKGLSAQVRQKIESACAAAVRSAEYQQQAERVNTPPVYRDGKNFEKFVLKEYADYGKLIKTMGLDKE